VVTTPSVPSSVLSAPKVACRHQVGLILGPGEYNFDVGLASVSITDWKKSEDVSNCRNSGDR